MKHTILMIIVLLISLVTFSQTLMDTTIQENADIAYDNYIQKSLKKKQTARTLLYSGGGLATAGLMYNIMGGKDASIVHIFSGFIMIGTGFLTMGSSIPFYISSNKWDKKALELKPAVGFEKINIPSNKNVQPSVGLAIHL